MCKARGDASVPATVADHIVPHRGNERAFWFGALQSLCKTCHDKAKRHLEKKGFDRTIGIDGLPIDPNHPFYTGKVP